MFVIADLETRKVLAYKDGTRIVYGSEELARNHAGTAQELSQHPHAVMHLLGIGSGNINSLGRQTAPWL